MTDLRKKEPIFVGQGFGVDFLMSLMFFFGISSLGIFLLCYVHVIRVPYEAQFSALIVVLAYVFIRRLRIGLGAMLLLHIFATCFFLAAFYFVSGQNDAARGIVIYLACLLVLNIIYSFKQRLNRSQTRVTNEGLLFALIMHVALFAVFVATGYHFRLNMITMNAVIMVTCFFVARQFDTFEDQYYHNIHSATQPVQSIKKQNRLLVILVVAGIAFAVIMLKVFPIDELSRQLSRILIAIFSWIAKFLPSGGEERPSAYIDMLDEPPEPEDTEGMENSLLVNILAAISIIIVATLLFIFIVTMIREIIKRFKKIDAVETTVENDAVVDIIEHIDAKNKNKISTRHDFGQGYEREIRKKYYKRVTAAIKAGLPIKASSSPRQIERIIKKSGDPSITELTSQYESVRYNKK